MPVSKPVTESSVPRPVTFRSGINLALDYFCITSQHILFRKIIVLPRTDRRRRRIRVDSAAIANTREKVCPTHFFMNASHTRGRASAETGLPILERRA